MYLAVFIIKIIVLLGIPIAMIGLNSISNQELELEELNKYLFSEYAIKMNTQLLNNIVTQDFVLIAASRMLEKRKY